ncbi:TPA: ribbon-helix-helix protein, CopG family [Vibrio parahaemolyticus]|nr:ribbon-helix-helix protein, CopG family [Vibrio parahaemolyticus]HBC3383661.1 ribbon-helix-helix protein, CopG family [Vibrio parahaemolyticus]HBC3445840.1 ribbon-helix-helix protein, CopG family [Vibrio parahaemolyticus]HBC3845866.1 ribbon-helix-helix protein, CopG family [Vibrio parahaemolyticus]HBH7861983.1 ribbon-helix-helix protein, CopG family [Vibrio parahaemolyticus]
MSITKTKKTKPFKEDNEKTERLIKFYVTEDQKEWLDELVKDSNFKSRSTFIRNSLILASHGEKIVIKQQQDLSTNLKKKLNGMANNINQAMHAYYVTDDKNEIDKIRKELESGKQLLLEMQKLIDSNVKIIQPLKMPIH